jgi:predicted Zn-dependent protease
MSQRTFSRTGSIRVAIAGLVAVVLGNASPAPAAAQYLSFIRDTEIETLLGDYAKPIFRAAGLGTGRVSMRVVKHDSFNAFVLDGHNVFIHTGTLAQSDTPNQVIGVIAHEAGHIAGGHLAQLRDRIARDQTKSLLVKLLGIGLIVAGGASSTDGAAGAGVGVMTAGDEIIMRSLLADRRAQESSADQSGLRYLNATKQSGKGMLETFERFAQQEYISASGNTQDAFVRSHPVAADRLAQLRDAVGKSPNVGEKDPPALQLRHDLMRAKIAGYLDRPQVVFNRYPPANRALPARYARAIATYFQRGLDAAAPEVEALIKERPDYPYFHELKADLLIRSGKGQEAIPHLRHAMKLTGSEPPLMAVRLAQALIASNDPKNVEDAIAMARKSLHVDQNPQAYRILAQGYGTKGLTPQADIAIAEAHFLEGNIKQAKIFAQRSQRGLKSGSPEALRAGDIMNYKLVGSSL